MPAVLRAKNDRKRGKEDGVVEAKIKKKKHLKEFGNDQLCQILLTGQVR